MRSTVIQIINPKQGVIGTDAVAVVYGLQTSKMGKIFQSKVQDACARRDF